MKNIPSKNDLFRLARNLDDLKAYIAEAQFTLKEILGNMKEIEKCEKELFLLDENNPENAEEIAALKHSIEANQKQMQEFLDGDKNDPSFDTKLSALSDFHGIEDIVVEQMRNTQSA